MNKARMEITVAVVSYVTIFLVYYLLIPGLDDSLSNLVYRGLIYAVSAVVLPIVLFGARDYAAKYGYRRAGLTKSAVIGAILALPLFALGYSAAAGCGRGSENTWQAHGKRCSYPPCYLASIT